jgi:signal transduction histidine kinase/ActR/RegA family two-component response regulator
MAFSLNRLYARLPLHLREDKRLYMVGLLVLCISATVVTAMASPHAGIRLQCAVATLLLLVLLLRSLMGASVEQTLRIGTLLAVFHITGEAIQNNQIYASSLTWLALMPVTQFHIHGRAEALRWTFVGLACTACAMLIGIWQGEAAIKAFGILQAPTSLSEYFLAAIGIIVVPWIYSKRYEEALAAIQQRQRDLQAKQVELEYAQQMQEHFIASVSHELRTPMNAILGLNNLLLERVKDKPQASKVLAYTRQSADHLMTVINDVLDYSQFNMGQISARVERFALRETVQAAFELFQPKVENTTLRYTCEIGADVPQWVSTDRHRLMQVLVNLLGNAIKFTHQGGVTLQVSAVDGGVVDGGVVFAIQDTGIGIASDQQQRIFERFSQADASIQSRYGGSGLGLTISQRLVQMLGGQLQLESHEGAGSRFWFWLPMPSVAAPEARAHEKEQVSAGGGQGLRFLVVDDHPVNRLLVQQVLARHWPQADVEQAQDGREALQKLQQQGFDLVLMDMVMPVMDGIEATTLLRASADARMRQTPVLGLTANVNAGDLARFEQAGLNGLLLKPFDVEQLLTEATHQVLIAQQKGAAT